MTLATGSAGSYGFEAHRINGGINADDGYWEGLQEGEFRLPRCPVCGTWRWPAHFRCGSCGGWDQEWVPVEPRGVVYSWTRTWYAFDRTQHRAEDVPYVVVLAQIPHAGGARVLGVLRGPETELRIGATVTGSIDPPSEKSLGYPAIRWTLEAGA
jgi:uncharacterized OB-fold protein